MTPEQRSYLIGKQYQERKQDHGGDRRSDVVVSTSQSDTLKAVADEHKIGRASVYRAAKFAEAVDNITENVGGEKHQSAETAT